MLAWFSYTMCSTFSYHVYIPCTKEFHTMCRWKVSNAAWNNYHKVLFFSNQASWSAASLESFHQRQTQQYKDSLVSWCVGRYKEIVLCEPYTLPDAFVSASRSASIRTVLVLSFSKTSCHQHTTTRTDPGTVAGIKFCTRMPTIAQGSIFSWLRMCCLKAKCKE